VYVYAPELDREAHRSGVGSSNWKDLLAKFDRAIQKTVAKLKPGVGLLVTADHGIVDVSASDHIFLDDCPAAKNGLSNVSGDPRSPYLYLSEPDLLQEIKGQLIEFLSDRAFVAEPRELVEMGYWSAKLLEEDDLMPDLVVIARRSFALFHRDFAKPSSLLMVGHHGSIDEVETKVPIIRFGDYSSSLLVP
jgi:predicted AlkP superfamily pyrophosphatase or phosphodiesterase